MDDLMGFILKIVSFIILALLHIIFLDIKGERMLIICFRVFVYE